MNDDNDISRVRPERQPSFCVPRRTRDGICQAAVQDLRWFGSNGPAGGNIQPFFLIPSMRYQIKEKLLSFGDDFRIKDHDGRDVYFVDGRAFNLLPQKVF